MKIPKLKKRYCPFCRRHTEHKVTLVGTGRVRGALKRGSIARARARGRARGMGNIGKWGKPAISKWKRKTKAVKKINLLFTCKVCGKSICQKAGKRASKITFKEK